jgi:hypothetical protein
LQTQEQRAFFDRSVAADRFVAAGNANHFDAVAAMLWDSGSFLSVCRSTPVQAKGWSSFTAPITQAPGISTPISAAIRQLHCPEALSRFLFLSTSLGERMDNLPQQSTILISQTLFSITVNHEHRDARPNRG